MTLPPCEPPPKKAIWASRAAWSWSTSPLNPALGPRCGTVRNGGWNRWVPWRKWGEDLGFLWLPGMENHGGFPQSWMVYHGKSQSINGGWLGLALFQETSENSGSERTNYLDLQWSECKSDVLFATCLAGCRWSSVVIRSSGCRHYPWFLQGII